MERVKITRSYTRALGLEIVRNDYPTMGTIVGFPRLFALEISPHALYIYIIIYIIFNKLPLYYYYNIQVVYTKFRTPVGR